MNNTPVNLKLKKLSTYKEVVTYRGIDIIVTCFEGSSITLRADLEIDGTWHKTGGEFTAKILIDKLLQA